MFLRQGIRKHHYVTEKMLAPLNNHYETMDNQAYRRPKRDTYVTETRNTKTPPRRWENVSEKMPAPLNSHYEIQWINKHTNDQWGTTIIITELKNTKTPLRQWENTSCSLQPLWPPVDKQAYRRPMRNNYVIKTKDTKTQLRQWENASSS